jgi:CheY-like chemotaxis protein
MNKTILVVDDDDDIRETLKEALEFEGYAVNVAYNGAHAIESLQKMVRLPDLIILDLMMPVMDGSKFLEVIHSDYKDSFAKIPLILASAKGSLSNFENSELAQEKIKKPVDLDELYQVVKKYCGGP